MTIKTLLKKISTNGEQADIETIQRAYNFAAKAHKKQKRENGEKYINHSLNTALTLAQLKLDAPTIAAGILHDVIDDSNITKKELENKFGKEIAFLVSGVTKLDKIQYRGVERHIENLRKMFLAISKDVRIVLIKLADRLHNMQTLYALPEKKQKRIAKETLEIYAPIAHRLGIGKLKGDLEDLAFPYVYPQKYEWLKNKIQERYQEREAYLKKIKPIVKKRLEKANLVPLDIHCRAKHYFSLYRKLQKYNMNFGKIYDLIALRIIVPNLESCYTALGIIHQHWKPLPGRIQDYIANPKANGYQSLHSTVFCVGGKITEFQIRTPELHWEAEFGIAAHWTHKEQGPRRFYTIKKTQTEWIKELKTWQKDINKPKEFLKLLRADFFKYRIFALTPKGNVVNLPEGATPIDFAYQVHTELGHRCGGAKVDGVITSLNYSLQNGQIVDIMVKKEAKPSQNWIRFAKTNYAKNKIKNWFKEQENQTKTKKIPELFPQLATIEILARDKIGLLKDITTILSKLKINIININTSEPSKGLAIALISLEISNIKQLNKAIKELKTIKEIWEVKRI